MNKYSKRALKTTVTVGMSLAMVLSGVAAPAVTNVQAHNFLCSVTERSQAEQLIAAIKFDLNAVTGTKTLKNVQVTDVIAWTETVKLLKGATDVVAGNGANATMTQLLEGTVTVGISDITLKALMTRVADCYKLDEAVFLVGHEDDTNRKNISEATTLLDTAIAAVAAYAGNEFTGAAGVNAYGQYQDLTNFYAKFKGNLTAAQKLIYDTKFPAFETAVLEYRGSSITTMTRNYVNALEALTVFTGGPTVGNLWRYNDTTFLHTDSDKLVDLIKDIKENKKGTLTSVASYKEVENEDAVSEIITRLEEIVEEIKEVKTLISPSNTLTKEYKKLKNKIDTLAVAAAAVKLAGSAVTDAQTLAYETAIAAFRADEIQTVVDYVEGVTNQMYTVKVRNYSSGNVGLELDEAEFGRYITSGEAIPTSLITILTTNLVKTSEESVYDQLTSHTSDTDKLIKACTTDIEGLTLGSKVTDANAAKIIAAKKAYVALLGANSEYTLTFKEKRAVKANETLIDALYTKLILSGIVTTTGWIDKGNGNWDFINADGSTSTKWVAAGTDWYFVKAGAMLRNSWIAKDSTGAEWYYVNDAGKMVSNTTINGYVINANGIWVK